MAPSPPHAPKPLDRPRARLFILAGGAAILIVGLLAAPRSARAPRPSETPTPILTDQERDPARTFRTLPRVARDVLPATVALEMPGDGAADTAFVDDWQAPQPAMPAAHYGLVVSADGDVLTDASGLAAGAGVRVRLAAGRTMAARVRVLDPARGLALLRLDGMGPFVSATLARRDTAPGDLVVAVAPVGGTEAVAPGFLVTTTGDTWQVGGLPPGFTRGVPLFNVNGEAVAITTERQGRPTAYPVAAALDRLEQLVRLGIPIPSASGLSLQAIDAALASAFGTSGVLVADVAPGSPAEAAGVQPGDVLLRVNGTPAQNPAQARRLIAALPAAADAALLLVRSGEEIEVAVRPQSVLQASWTGRRRFTAEGVEASRLAPPELLEAVGLSPDARVLSINGRPPGERRAGRPVAGVVQVELDGRRFFAVLPELQP